MPDFFTNDTLRLAVFFLEASLALTLIYWMRSSLQGRPEPWRFFFLLLLYGGLAALVSAAIEIRYSFDIPALQMSDPQLVARYGTWYELLNGAAAASIEELAKYMIAVFMLFNGRHVHKLSDAIVYLIIVGLGFSLVEDIAFLLNPSTIAPYRLLSFLVHSGTSAVIGYSLGRYLSGVGRRLEVFWAVLGAILLHFGYNLSVTLHDGLASFYLTAAITAYISLQIFVLFRKAIQEEYRLGHRFRAVTTQRLLNL